MKTLAVLSEKHVSRNKLTSDGDKATILIPASPSQKVFEVNNMSQSEIKIDSEG